MSGRRQFGRMKDFLFEVQNTSIWRMAGYMDLNDNQLLVWPVFENLNEDLLNTSRTFMNFRQKSTLNSVKLAIQAESVWEWAW